MLSELVQSRHKLAARPKGSPTMARPKQPGSGLKSPRSKRSISAGQASAMDPPEEEKKWALICRVRQRDLRRVARDRRDDPHFSWSKFGDFAANEQRKIHNAKAPSVETVLCHGKMRVFARLADVPPHIANAVAAGIAKAMARRRPMYRDADDFANGLNVAMADRERLGVWQVGANDCSRDERQIRQKEKRNETQRRRRREAGMMARKRYEGASLEKLEPWKLAGRSRRWFYNQAETVRERLRNEALEKCTSLKLASLIYSDGFTLVHSPSSSLRPAPPLEAGTTSVPPIDTRPQLGLFAAAALPLCSKPSHLMPCPPPVRVAQTITFPPPFPEPVSVLHRLEEKRKQVAIRKLPPRPRQARRMGFAPPSPNETSLRRLRETSALILDVVGAPTEPTPVLSPVEFADARARVDLLLASMAEETERRRDWFTQPVEGWGEGRLVLRGVDGKTEIIELRNRQNSKR